MPKFFFFVLKKETKGTLYEILFKEKKTGRKRNDIKTITLKNNNNNTYI